MPINPMLVSLLLERCFIGGKIDGVVSLPEPEDGHNIETPLVGILGGGTQHQREKRKNAWIQGELLSPYFTANNGCACKSHIEGVVTDSGEMRFLEMVYDFPAREGDCFEYNLTLINPESATSNRPLEFRGNTIARINRNGFKPTNVGGEVILFLNSYWEILRTGTSRVASLPIHNRHYVNGTYIPNFWKEFLGQIEEQGYDHPYGAVSDKLQKERDEKEAAKTR